MCLPEVEDVLNEASTLENKDMFRAFYQQMFSARFFSCKKAVARVFEKDTASSADYFLNAFVKHLRMEYSRMLNGKGNLYEMKQLMLHSKLRLYVIKWICQEPRNEKKYDAVVLLSILMADFRHALSTSEFPNGISDFVKTFSSFLNASHQNGIHQVGPPL